MKQRRLRVRAFIYDRGWGKYQLLQEKRWWGWMTIDREEVPRHVVISLGAYGDTGGWSSKFLEHGTFGRDGYLNQRGVS